MLYRSIIVTLCAVAVHGGRSRIWKERKNESKRNRKISRSLRRNDYGEKATKVRTVDNPVLRESEQFTIFVDSPITGSSVLEMPCDVTAGGVVRKVFGTRPGVLSFAGQYLGDREILADAGVCPECWVTILPGAVIPVDVWPVVCSEDPGVMWETTVLASTFAEFVEGLRSQVIDEFKPTAKVLFMHREGQMWQIVEELRPYILDDCLPQNEEEARRILNPERRDSVKNRHFEIQIRAKE